MTTVPVLPDSAPFTSEQRAWLNGFFAGLFSTGAQTIAPAAPAVEDDGAPWHDQTMPAPERMKLAEGRPLRRRMMAAMAQQDCGQCGYLCDTYADALAEGKETRLNLCAPGGKETARLLRSLAEEKGPAPLAVPAIIETPAAEKGRSRESPAAAIFLSRARLNGEGSEKETHHIEFDLAPAGLSYEPGDSFGVFAANPPALVRAVARRKGLALDEPITAGGETRSFGDWLTYGKSLSSAPDALFALLATLSPTPKERAHLEALAAGDDSEGDLDVLDALRKYPHLAPTPARFLESLDPLQPRLYSISSSPRAHPGRLSLTVDVVRHRIGERMRLGVASTFLAERVKPDDRVRVYVQRSHGFGPPKNPDAPIVMVGPGTGIAPFRAFLQDRMAAQARGPAWLFYGHQREATDFFYRDELMGFSASGVLSRLSTAWSRDGARKVYVQDRMRENGADLFRWLEEGAHFYVCGDAKRMAADVDRALHEIVAEHGRADPAAYVRTLKESGRYQRDVY